MKDAPRPDSSSACQVSDHFNTSSIFNLLHSQGCWGINFLWSIQTGAAFIFTRHSCIQSWTLIGTPEWAVCSGFVRPLEGDSEKDKTLATQRDHSVYTVRINDFIWASRDFIVLEGIKWSGNYFKALNSRRLTHAATWLKPRLFAENKPD